MTSGACATVLELTTNQTGGNLSVSGSDQERAVYKRSPG